MQRPEFKAQSPPKKSLIMMCLGIGFFGLIWFSVFLNMQEFLFSYLCVCVFCFVFAANFEMFSAINALSTFFFCFHSVVQIE
jgi:hypothetical protein